MIGLIKVFYSILFFYSIKNDFYMSLISVPIVQ